MFRRHGPILATVAGAIATFFLLFFASSFRGELARASVSTATISLFLAGFLYTQFFEFAAHRFAMHRGLPWLADVRRNHLEHHHVFHGDRFRTNRPEDLEHIAGRFWIFPLLLTLHFVAARLILPLELAMAFLLGTVLHYIVFETSHWLTHLADNAVDRAIERIPGLRSVRRYQIEHHRIHHELPIVAFNFNPPYLGDRLAGLMPGDDRLPLDGPLVPSPALPSVLVASSKPLRASIPGPPARGFLTHPLARYGTVVAIGAAALWLGVAAHGWWAKDRRPSPEAHAKRAL